MAETKYGHPLVDEMLLRLAQVRVMYQRVYEDNLTMRESLKSAKAMTEGQMVDLAYIVDKISGLCDDLRKECNTTSGLLDDAVCALWTIKAMTNPDSVKPTVDGAIASGTPDMKHKPTLPKKDTPERMKLYTALGIPTAMHNMVDLHWPRYCDYCTELAKQGKPYPDGQNPNQVYPKYKLIIRVQKDVNIDDILATIDKVRKAKRG